MGFNDNENENIGKNISMGIAETRLKIRIQINGRKKTKFEIYRVLGGGATNPRPSHNYRHTSVSKHLFLRTFSICCYFILIKVLWYLKSEYV